MRPMLWKFERRAAAMGYQVVAGVDEVGMGPLAVRSWPEEAEAEEPEDEAAEAEEGDAES